MVTSTDNKRSPQWLALHFPHLALDQYNCNRGQAKDDIPQAISDKLSGRQCIIDHNQAAERAGIHIGMPTGAALSLADSLQLSVRDRRAEQAGLKRLASWCYQYSSQVCINGELNSLLLEVAASRRLFGIAETLAIRINTELGQLGYRVNSGFAPTPEAAHLAARHGLQIHTTADIRKNIGALGIDGLNLQLTSIKALQKMGFRTAAEVFRLPRKALARRLGLSVSDYLDRLLGVRPDPGVLYQPPETFSSRLELPAEIHNRRALLFPLKRLLEELCGVLRGGDTAVQSLRIILGHEDSEDSRFELGLQSPAQDSGRLMTVLRERLERLRLPQAVREIRIEAPKLLRFSAGQHSLFHDTEAERRQDIEQLAERLQARLGSESVTGLTGVEDHRPEYSWRPRALNEPADCTALAHRPAWLLPKPRRCTIGNFEILAGPERIESGWWDGRDCRRDYFIVRAPHGSTLWAFREYKPRRGWYLHGIFA